MSHQQYLVAAFKQRLADSLHDYADLTEPGAASLDDEPGLIRGIRFALLDGGNSRYRTNGRTQARTVERFVAMLRVVPSAGSADSQFVKAPRWAMIALAVAAGLVSVAAVLAPVLIPALRP